MMLIYITSMSMELIRLSSLGRKAPRTVPPEAASSSPAVEKVPHALGRDSQIATFHGKVL